MGRRTRGDGCEASLDRPRTAIRKPFGQHHSFAVRKPKPNNTLLTNYYLSETPSNKDI
jgi:hypothetical protein